MLGTKQNMSQIFDEDGNVYPVTLISALPVLVTAIKKADGKDKYDAIQVGYGSRSLNRLNKAERGHVSKNLKADARGFSGLREFRTKDDSLNLGSAVKLDSFNEGDKVTVSAISKGKGFQGVVKRHGFHGGPRSHGQKHNERAPGSIGAGGRQGVMKNMRMAGRMGSDKITVKNLKLLKIDKENNILAVSGAIPGRRGTLVEIYK